MLNVRSIHLGELSLEGEVLFFSFIKEAHGVQRLIQHTLSNVSHIMNVFNANSWRLFKNVVVF
jgi:hypothetical protein